MQLADIVETAGPAFGDMTFCGVVVDAPQSPNMARRSDQPVTFFQTSALRAEGERVELLPPVTRMRLPSLGCRKAAAALSMCAPPDAAGSIVKVGAILHSASLIEVSARGRKELVVPVAGVEPATFGLQNRCSTN